ELAIVYSLAGSDATALYESIGMREHDRDLELVKQREVASNPRGAQRAEHRPVPSCGPLTAHPPLELDLLDREAVRWRRLHDDAGDQQRMLRLVLRASRLHDRGAGEVSARPPEHGCERDRR